MAKWIQSEEMSLQTNECGAWEWKDQKRSKLTYPKFLAFWLSYVFKPM